MSSAAVAGSAEATSAGASGKTGDGPRDDEGCPPPCTSGSSPGEISIPTASERVASSFDYMVTNKEEKKKFRKDNHRTKRKEEVLTETGFRKQGEARPEKEENQNSKSSVRRNSGRVTGCKNSSEEEVPGLRFRIFARDLKNSSITAEFCKEMGEEESPKVEAESPSEPAPEPTPAPAPAAVEPTKDVTEEKTVIPPPEEKVDDSKAPAIVEKVPDSEEEKTSGGSVDRDAVLTRVETEKRLSLIQAWEESEKTKAENKAYKKLSGIKSWENSKKATVEAKLKRLSMVLPYGYKLSMGGMFPSCDIDDVPRMENLEKKKAEQVEKLKNKVAFIHKTSEEKKAMVIAKREEDLLKAEEIAAKYRAAGTAPKNLFGCFGG
ncbi:hypothetical protein HHK36_032677 [Tetracentron sinense]|uniref:Remorin C-terminal domain-containing protein n=1 Tax=Tetracentron sinense TaxID=13715 RepID=A0A834YAG3_TETSI|nr:hypothetical protein HHK36_032677 [Tetracentron sinense]